MISNEQFEAFKIACQRYADDFGLQSYELTFKLKKLKNCWAECIVDEEGKIAIITLASNSTDICIDDVAKHEVLHVLLHRLRWYGETEFNSQHILNEEEKIVRILEKLI